MRYGKFVDLTIPSNGIYAIVPWNVDNDSFADRLYGEYLAELKKEGSIK